MQDHLQNLLKPKICNYVLGNSYHEYEFPIKTYQILIIFCNLSGLSQIEVFWKITYKTFWNQTFANYSDVSVSVICTIWISDGNLSNIDDFGNLSRHWISLNWSFWKGLSGLITNFYQPSNGQVVFVASKVITLPGPFTILQDE